MRALLKKRLDQKDKDGIKKPRLFPHDFMNQIICGDCLEIMQQIPDESIDLVVTSPPYNLRHSTGKSVKYSTGRWKNAAILSEGYSHHSDNMPHAEYVAWQRPFN